MGSVLLVILLHSWMSRALPGEEEFQVLQAQPNCEDGSVRFQSSCVSCSRLCSNRTTFCKVVKQSSSATATSTSHVRCECPSTYTGQWCERRVCPPGKWGVSCEKECFCNSNSIYGGNTCNPVNGKCSCDESKGRGRYCSKCPVGYFQNKHLKCQECACVHDSFPRRDGIKSCDPDSGMCDHCLAGYKVPSSRVPCSHLEECLCNTCDFDHYLSADKSACFKCACNPMGSKIRGDQRVCDHDYGSCFCLPGYRGEKCQFCQEGHVLDSASRTCVALVCNCDPEGSTTHQGRKCSDEGNCFCKPGYLGRSCSELATLISTQNPTVAHAADVTESRQAKEQAGSVLDSELRAASPRSRHQPASARITTHIPNGGATEPDVFRMLSFNDPTNISFTPVGSSASRYWRWTWKWHLRDAHVSYLLNSFSLFDVDVALPTAFAMWTNVVALSLLWMLC